MPEGMPARLKKTVDSLKKNRFDARIAEDWFFPDTMGLSSN